MHLETTKALKVFSIVAAGGLFLDNRDAEVLGEIYAPEDLKKKLTKDHQYFVGQIEGHSMEPEIPSGSYLLLRGGVTGSRTGRTVLVEERKVGECAYTLKTYLRCPGKPGRILLRSRNEEFPDIEISENGESDDQRYGVIAEYIRVLKQPLNWAKSPWEERGE